MRTAIILGCAGSVWIDAAESYGFGRYDLTIAINDIIARWSGHVDIAATLHPDKMAGWRDDRKRAGYPQAAHHVGHIPADGIDEGREYRFPGQPSSGSSGLFAVKLAMDEGCERIVLAGVPMSDENGHISDGRLFAVDCHEYRKTWEWALPILRGKVKSLSGWTAETLGKASLEWLNG